MSVSGYTHLHELGAGAGGVVFAARHDATGVPVAIKYLADELRTDPEFVRAYRLEARIMTELDDQHIARLYEYVEDSTTTAIVMELIDGPALSAVLANGGGLTPEAALLVMYGSLSALATAHERGVIHRDYKPGNVLVSRTGDSVLADFGIAVRSGADGLTSGSPSYMAPEQWAGGPAGPPADIYAATATFVECLTGRPPFTGADLETLARQHRNAPVPVDAVPEPVRGLVAAGLAKSPARRPASANAFLLQLTDAAITGYGEEWAERGRAHLAARAAALLALLPAGVTELAGIDLARTRLGRFAVAGGAAVLALVVGGGAAALTPVVRHETSVHLAGPTEHPSPGVPTGPVTTTSRPGATPSRTRSRARTSPVATPTVTAATVPSTVLPPPVSTSRAVPPPPPVSTSATHAPPPTTVQKLEVTSFDWVTKPPLASLQLYVATSGTGPVHLTLEYTNGNGFDHSAAVTTLSGATTYYPTDSEDFSGVCGTVKVIAKTDAGGFTSATLPYAQC